MELQKAWIEDNVLYFSGFLEGTLQTIVAGRVGDKDEDGYETTLTELENVMTYMNVMLEPSEQEA